MVLFCVSKYPRIPPACIDTVPGLLPCLSYRGAGGGFFPIGLTWQRWSLGSNFLQRASGGFDKISDMLVDHPNHPQNHQKCLVKAINIHISPYLLITCYSHVNWWLYTPYNIPEMLGKSHQKWLVFWDFFPHISWTSGMPPAFGRWPPPGHFWWRGMAGWGLAIGVTGENQHLWRNLR